MLLFQLLALRNLEDKCMQIIAYF